MVLDGRTDEQTEGIGGRTDAWTTPKPVVGSILVLSFFLKYTMVCALNFSETKVKHMHFVFYVAYKYKTKRTCNIQATYENL